MQPSTESLGRYEAYASSSKYRVLLEASVRMLRALERAAAALCWSLMIGHHAELMQPWASLSVLAVVRYAGVVGNV